MLHLAAPALVAGALLIGVPGSGAEQDGTPSPQQNVPVEDQACCAVPAMTPVEIEIAEGVNSRTRRSGDRFAIRLAEPLVVGGRVIAPAGTKGVGEVVHAAKARAMGKAGELILAARYLEIGGQRLPLRSFRYGKSQGLDNSGALGVGNMVASAVLPVASVLAFVVAGGEVDIPAGTRANAKVSADTRIAAAE